jgi:hypothetical protein
MPTIYADSLASDDERRRRLYDGQLYIYRATSASAKLCALARNLIEKAFHPLDPMRAQFEMPVEQFVSIVAPLKPRFIHHPDTRRLTKELIQEMGCDPELTYIDVPRLRIVTDGGYLTSGVGYAHHPHRDVWYSAPLSQINWWVPIYDIQSENSMAFHPRYWSEPIKNDSADFDYYRWNREGRASAASHIKSDTRKQPKPQQPLALQPEVRVVTEPAGILLFSAAQLHSTVPNTSGVTRFSIDFRTVCLRDAIENRGAPNIDSGCTGTSLRDFVRASDFAAMPEEVALRFDHEHQPDDVLVYKPPQSVGV